MKSQFPYSRKFLQDEIIRLMTLEDEVVSVKKKDRIRKRITELEYMLIPKYKQKDCIDHIFGGKDREFNGDGGKERCIKCGFERKTYL